MNRKKELEKMIYSLGLQIDSLEKDIFQKKTLKEEAVRLIWKYEQELETINTKPKGCGKKVYMHFGCPVCCGDFNLGIICKCPDCMKENFVNTKEEVKKE